MKLEFIKETTPKGDAIYFTECDGKFVQESLRLDKDTALKIFEFYKETKSISPVKEVLESVEI